MALADRPPRPEPHRPRPPPAARTRSRSPASRSASWPACLPGSRVSPLRRPRPPRAGGYLAFLAVATLATRRSRGDRGAGPGGLEDGGHARRLPRLAEDASHRLPRLPRGHARRASRSSLLQGRDAEARPSRSAPSSARRGSRSSSPVIALLELVPRALRWLSCSRPLAAPRRGAGPAARGPGRGLHAPPGSPLPAEATGPGHERRARARAVGPTRSVRSALAPGGDGRVERGDGAGARGPPRAGSRGPRRLGTARCSCRGPRSLRSPIGPPRPEAPLRAAPGRPPRRARAVRALRPRAHLPARFADGGAVCSSCASPPRSPTSRRTCASGSRRFIAHLAALTMLLLAGAGLLSSRGARGEPGTAPRVLGAYEQAMERLRDRGRGAEPRASAERRRMEEALPRQGGHGPGGRADGGDRARGPQRPGHDPGLCAPPGARRAPSEAADAARSIRAGVRDARDRGAPLHGLRQAGDAQARARSTCRRL